MPTQRDYAGFAPVLLKGSPVLREVFLKLRFCVYFGGTGVAH
jgi:hypothetical protein